MAKSNEPAVWSLFSAGGVLTAFLAPVLIVMTGFVAVWPGLSYPTMHAVFTHMLVRIVLFFLAFLAFFHAAHRFRFTLVDLGLKPLKMPIAVGCYAAAVIGTVWAGMVLFFS